MATEEIGLNEALEGAGVRPVETDLGEYLLQLAGEHPRHIVAPAIELTVEECAELLSASRGRASCRPTARRSSRRRAASCASDFDGRGRHHRRELRRRRDRIGLLVTNEGNARLVSSLPRVHIAVMGMERVVPTLADLAVLLQLLGRSGTGQPLTVYTTLLTGPRGAGERTGPRRATSSSSTTAARACAAAATSRCSPASAAAPA